MKKHSLRSGFTLVELLTVVLIIGVLTGIALPSYTRSIERSRATEAMALLKTINDAAYAFSAQRNRCPKFSELVVSLPGTPASDFKISSKNFSYELNKASAQIPGTDCGGTVASRINGGADYDYKIWNPYTVGGGAGARSLACHSAKAKSIVICKSLDIYSTTAP